jgi:hypothetical protein
MDLSKHEDTIRQLIDSFRKMCDYIETTDEIGCSNCPVFHECFHNDKHKGLLPLMNDLGIERG